MKSSLMWAALWVYNVLLAIDQLGSALGGAPAGQTLSALAWKSEREGRILGKVARPFIDWLFKPIEKNHCRNAWDSDPSERLNAVKHMYARWKRGQPIIWRP